ncbi:unnamed protein product [Ilex paraguariensis]|uniref:Uncharacterized protein n=1 Tax=Ilex paraguariensis TaxID=185542 RepID=A0ABC8SCR2_9AQUA
MRALQELIPNCNKIMSMGTGLYMPPMMLPTGMQHIHAAYMPHFSPMGMGMGMGFGLGMVDINGGPPGCPMIPMPHMQGAHFPSRPISGPSTFQGITGSNLQVFGHPGQGLPMSVHRAPLVPLPGRPPEYTRMETNVGVPNAASCLNSKDMMQNDKTQGMHNADTSSSMNQICSQNTNSQLMHNADTCSSMNQTSGQFQETNEDFDQPAPVQKNDQSVDLIGSAAVNLANVNNIIPSKTAGCE